MTTQDGGLIRNQNLDFHFDVAPVGVKTNLPKPLKNGGGLGGRRKALNDISNSGRPSALQVSKKHNSKTVTSVGEDFGSSKPITSFGGKRNVSKAPEISQAVGRRALSDLTNSGKAHVHLASKKSQDGKLKAVAEEQILPHSVVEEQFLHNHQECIKAQRKGVDIDCFLKTVGLHNDNSIQLASPHVSPPSWKLKPESPAIYMEMEEMSELLYEDQSKWKKTELPSEQTPCGSPESSPKPLMQWNDYNFPSFVLMESPKLLKH
ncbi:hypothetical protein Acr_03g0000980 [Actinidia rufa]|uniref:Uncharacterized protein n=1 Tax=Actinidia rufa TaxID=165716 RepID=A0A7J0EA05_9ERIC|nr:hypothetical protein Acr_03g0000980 [Actinidia rufa]